LGQTLSPEVPRALIRELAVPAEALRRPPHRRRGDVHRHYRHRFGRSGPLMQLPAQLETKFGELIARYPVKRSALIPMMLYAQDHYGSLTDELIAEIAQRVDVNILQ